MKKIIITTALALTITSATTPDAAAYDRFLKLRHSQPSVQVNYGALQYLYPEAPIGEIKAAPRSEKIIKRPIKPAKGTENKPTITKPVEVKKPVEAPKPAPAPAPVKAIEKPKPMPTIEPKVEPLKTPELKPLEAPKSISLVPLEMPNLDVPKSPEAPKLPLPKPAALAPAPKKLPEAKLPEKPLEMPKLAEPKTEVPKLEAPKLPEPKLPEPVKAPAPAPKAALAPIVPPTKTANPNEVVLPPLFPADSAKTAAAPATPATPPALPPLKNLFDENKNNADNIEIPKLPDTSAEDSKADNEVVPNIPAPNINDVQINNKVPQPAVVAQIPAKDISYSFPFNETETELPISEQPKLLEISTMLKANPNMEMTVNSYASGSADQSSQSKRTSLARALSVRRFMLENKVETNQIIIRPNGNDSGNGLPDRVDIQVSKKVGT